MDRTLAALLLLAPVLASAAPPPVSAVVESEAYASAEQAAVAGLRIAMARSGRYENGGAVVAKDGSFYRTEPVSNGDEGHIRFAVEVPAGARLVAIFHTHPDAGPQTRLFSQDDVAEAAKLGLTSYIGVMDDRVIRRFTPGVTPTRPYTPPGSSLPRGRVSDGETVLALLNL
ncbi:MAG: hypothetical protein HY079_06575 [Elusimicrobia bacterium]|nr:hypothetical protein [Elusimicrobiota bacterium]